MRVLYEGALVLSRSMDVVVQTGLKFVMVGGQLIVKLFTVSSFLLFSEGDFAGDEEEEGTTTEGNERKDGRILLFPNILRACRGGGKGIAGPIVVFDECGAEVCEIVCNVRQDGIEGRATAAANKATEILLQRC